MPINMQDDIQGEQLTESFEDCKLQAYWDATGKVWTIGWGHTGPEVVEGLVWTQAQCDAQLLVDRRAAVACVNRNVNVPLTKNEFRALVDWVFNAGCGHFVGSTMLRLLNAGDYHGAAAEIDKWIFSGGVKLAGLLRRRRAETALFEQPDTSSGSQV